MKEPLVCSVCGAGLTKETANEFEGQIMCASCLEAETTLCDCCGERISYSSNHGNDAITLCARCYDNNYNTCEECGALIRNDNAYYFDDSDYPYCSECYQTLRDNGPIKEYNYKPEPIFYGSGDLFMGVELEIDKGDEINSNAQKLLNIPETLHTVYFEYNRQAILNIVNNELNAAFTDIIFVTDGSIDISKKLPICGYIT